MNSLDLSEVRDYVNENIADFHRRRINSLEALPLKKLLAKNPYLFRAKNITTANDLVTGLLDAFLSSSEEKLFGDFLEGLAVFIAGKTCGGHKSTAQGADLEFFNNNVHHIVSIKSGTNWGSSSQHSKLEEDLRTAVARVKQSSVSTNVQPIVGICYGKTKTSYVRGYLKVVGQNFWHFISQNKDLYTDIIEPIGHRAKEHNENISSEKSRVVHLFTKKFIDRFCEPTGAIDWTRLVESNSGNFDLDKFLP